MQTPDSYNTATTNAGKVLFLLSQFPKTYNTILLHVQRNEPGIDDFNSRRIARAGISHLKKAGILKSHGRGASTEAIYVLQPVKPKL
jgi:hypothetical protein